MTTLPDDDYPHTGMLSYEKDVAMIPAAALSTHSANELSALLKSDPKLTVNLKLSAAQHPLVSSFNVIGELTGRDLPARICGGGRSPRLVGSREPAPTTMARASCNRSKSCAL